MAETIADVTSLLTLGTGFRRQVTWAVPPTTPPEMRLDHHVMTLAGEWYKSGTFWAAAAVVAAIVVGACTIWATFKVANPKRRLDYALLSVTSLLQGSTSLHGVVEVTRAGTALADPQVIKVGLANRGRRDVPSSAFDSGQPIKIDVGVPIVDILDMMSKPAHHQLPSITSTGSTVLIGPGLISRNQSITISLLADGQQPAVSCQASLIDVDVSDRGVPPEVYQVAEVVAATGITPFKFSGVALKLMGPAIAVVYAVIAAGGGTAFLIYLIAKGG
ncbi:hypothetical protein ACVB8X_43270 [Streptomyces sp. NRAIS4]